MSVHSGWHLAAFTSELASDVSPLDLGSRRLVAVRDGEDLRVYDADCPHRGAHLGHGGHLKDGCLVCPFHGRRIQLGEPERGGGPRRWVREHQVIVWGETVFVRLADGPDDDRGFTRAAKELAGTHHLVPAVTRRVAVDPRLVVENAFDTDHFTALHKVYRVRGMHHRTGSEGELVMDGEFPMPASPWQGTRGTAPQAAYVPRFLARAYSPGVVVTEFGPPGQIHVIVTAAVPDGEGGCTVRVAVGAGRGHEGDLPMLVRGSERALAEDIAVWEHLNPHATQRLDAADEAVAAYRTFCTEFTDLSTGDTDDRGSET